MVLPWLYYSCVQALHGMCGLPGFSRQQKSGCNSDSVCLAAWSKIQCWERTLHALLVTACNIITHGIFYIYCLHCLICQLVWVLEIEKDLQKIYWESQFTMK